MANPGLGFAFALPTNAHVLHQTPHGARVRVGDILETRDHPVPMPPLLMRAQGVGPAATLQWQLIYAREPMNNELYMYGQLPVGDGITLRPFAECFPHLVQYTNDPCDNIVIVQESLEGDLTVTQVVPITAIGDHVHRW
jgi:hypothetical protein